LSCHFCAIVISKKEFETKVFVPLKLGVPSNGQSLKLLELEVCFHWPCFSLLSHSCKLLYFNLSEKLLFYSCSQNLSLYVFS